MFPYHLILFSLVVTVTVIACSLSTPSASAIAVDEAALSPTPKFNFDPEMLLRGLINVAPTHETPVQVISSGNSKDTFLLLYGADRPIPVLHFNLFNFIFHFKDSNTYLVLSSGLLYCILDYLTFSDLQNIIETGISEQQCIHRRLPNAFVQSVISFLKYKNPFPFIPAKSLHSLQLDNLTTAAKLINRIYPSLHLKGIESVEEIGNILELIYLNFHTDESFHVPKKTLEKFLLLFLFKRKTYYNFSNSRPIFISNINDRIFSKTFITSLHVSVQLGLITLADFKTKNFFNSLANSKSVHFVQESLMLLKKMPNSDKTIQDLVLHAVSIDNVIFLRGFLSACDHQTEAFLKRVISVTFGRGSCKVFQELLTNSVTIPFIESNPHLISLPEDYFETHYDSNDFLLAYLSCPFVVRNQPQNHLSNFILRAALNKFHDSLFLSLLNNENYPILPDLLPEIFDNLNVIGTSFKHQTVKEFWASIRVFNYFHEASFDHKRREIFGKILNGKLYYHLFALSECKFDYFDDILTRSDLTQHTAKLLLEEDFYKHSISLNELFIREFVTFKIFTSNPQFHCHYLLLAIKYKKYILFAQMAYSDSIWLSFDNFREIISGLSENEPAEDGRYSDIFWSESRSVRRIFIGFNEEARIQLVKQIITSKHYQQLYVILRYWPDDDDHYVISAQFDLVNFCLERGVDRAIIKDLEKKEYFKIRFPKSTNFLNRIQLEYFY